MRRPKKPSGMLRSESSLERLFGLSVLVYIVVMAVPFGIFLLVGWLAHSTGSSDPAWQQFGLTIVSTMLALSTAPAAAALYLAIRTFPLPLSIFDEGPSRSWMTFCTLFAAGLTSLVAGSILFGVDQLTFGGVIGACAAGMLILAFTGFVVRYIVGWLHLIPRSWRVSPSEEGTLEVSALQAIVYARKLTKAAKEQESAR